MNVNRIFHLPEVDYDETARTFLSRLWAIANFDIMLLPRNAIDGSDIQIINSSLDLVDAVPFDEQMVSNAASLVMDVVNHQKGKKIAALLRPCELRTLIELRKRGRVQWRTPNGDSGAGWLLLIGHDCETQPRKACQICDSTIPYGADISIGTLGMESFETQLLIIAKDEWIDRSFGLNMICQRMASEEEVVVREEVAGDIVIDHAKRRKDLFSDGSGEYEDLSNLLAFFSRCTLCTDCLDACPLYEGELASMLGVHGKHQQEAPLLSELVGVSRWLVSCSGCGMCQQACASNTFLMPLVSALSHQLRGKLNYAAGDPGQALPWHVANKFQEESLHVVP